MLPRVQCHLQNLQRDGIRVEAVTRQMPEFQRLMEQQRFAEAEAVLESMLDSLDE